MMGGHNGAATFKDSLAVYPKLNIILVYDQEITLPGVYPTD